MALIVQDITGTVEDANAYVSVADMKAWLALRGITLTQSDADIEIAIIKATDYIDTRFTFYGSVKATDQTTIFPRWGSTSIPPSIITACILYAKVALTGDLWQTAEEILEGGILAKTETVGPITESVTYQAAQSRHKEFAQADNLISLCGSAATSGQVAGRA